MEINRIPCDQCPTRVTGNYFNVNGNLKQKTYEYTDPFPYIKVKTMAKKGEQSCNEMARKHDLNQSGLQSMAKRMFGHCGRLSVAEYEMLESKALDKKQ